MKPQNFVRVLRVFVVRQPFRPFLVELVSGDRFSVRHPEALALRGSVAVYVDQDGSRKYFDCASVCQLYYVPLGTAAV